ncbi:MAG: FAD-binding oxidoreductase [Candidatus Schekmanbacteria bacterium]|nr:MAG: FAD-binding oxidoreductase [Candidatus Schekmanbacteria bacterium]
MSVREELKKIVGNENIVEDTDSLLRYCADESPFKGKMPNYAVKVKSADEIKNILKLANKKKIPVVPSSSKIHFNGASLPTQGGILLDMSEMDKILLIDERNRKIIIEPGVSWKKIDEELEKKKLRMFNPLFPHSGTSALTDLLERVPALIPKFEYADPILTLEAVFPTGDLMRTGSASITMSYKGDNPAVDLVCPYGPGMDFFRLFHGAQGTLGVVTWAAVKLEHRSPLKKLFLFGYEGIEDAISDIQKIQRSMIGQECFILDNTNASLILSQGDISKCEALKRKLPKFLAMLMLRGAKRRPEEKIAYEEKALKEIMKDKDNEISSSFEQESEWLKGNVEKCWPDEKVYWKNMLKGRVLQISYKTTANRIPHLLSKYEQIVSTTNMKNIECGLYIQPIEYGRAYHCEHHLYYEDNGKDISDKILSFNRQAVMGLNSEGAFFSTPYGDVGKIIFDKTGGYREAVRKIKNIFDPAGIMNPGRLSF